MLTLTFVWGSSLEAGIYYEIKNTVRILLIFLRNSGNIISQEDGTDLKIINIYKVKR
jgi:hypothetical protein